MAAVIVLQCLKHCSVLARNVRFALCLALLQHFAACGSLSPVHSTGLRVAKPETFFKVLGFVAFRITLRTDDGHLLAADCWT